MTDPTPAQRFRDAVWEAGPEELSQVETLVLLAYADHAKGSDTAWVAQSRLIHRCKLRSKGTPARVLAALVEKGWLVLLSPAQWHNKQSPRYRLVIPTTPSEGASKPPRSKRKPPRSEAKPPRLVAKTTPSDGAKLPVIRTRLSPEDPLDPREGEATPPAEPGAAPPEEQDPPAPPGAGRLAALAIAHGAKRRDVRLSRWSTPRPEAPNPAYTSAHAAAVAVEMPPYERPRVTEEEDDDE